MERQRWTEESSLQKKKEKRKLFPALVRLWSFDRIIFMGQTTIYIPPEHIVVIVIFKINIFLHISQFRWSFFFLNFYVCSKDLFNSVWTILFSISHSEGLLETNNLAVFWLKMSLFHLYFWRLLLTMYRVHRFKDAVLLSSCRHTFSWEVYC